MIQIRFSARPTRCERNSRLFPPALPSLLSSPPLSNLTAPVAGERHRRLGRGADRPHLHPAEPLLLALELAGGLEQGLDLRDLKEGAARRRAPQIAVDLSERIAVDETLPLASFGARRTATSTLLIDEFDSPRRRLRWVRPVRASV